MSEAQAAHALAALVTHLVPSLDAASLTDRLHCQTAAWMSVRGLAYAGLGLSHALGHQIGPRWNVAHGVTSCIILPHAMRAVAGRAPDRLPVDCDALGMAFDASDRPWWARGPARTPSRRSCRGSALPSRLRDVGVPREELGDVAGVVHEAMTHHPRVGLEVSLDEVGAGLVAAEYRPSSRCANRSL